MPPRTPALDAVFRATEYWVELPAGPLCLCVGARDPRADERLRIEAGVHRHWFILSPCNAYSEAFDDVKNNMLFNELEDILKVMYERVFHTRHRAPAGTWPEERGFFLPDFDPALARGLGRRYRQHALVAGSLGTAPELDWLTQEGEPHF